MNAGSERGSKLRNMLQNNTSPLSRQLFQEFQTIEARANEKWIPLLGHDKGSNSGRSHLQGVEEQISGILESTPDLNLSPAESFILLCGVIFHDLGKIVGQEKFDDIKKSRELENSFYKKHLSAKVKDTHHGIVSAVFLLSEYHRFGFTDLGIVTCIAHVCAAHDQETAKKLRDAEKLRDRYLDQYGRIRLSWLCALMTLGDELDNSYHRAAPKWLNTHPESKDNEKGRLRARLSGCEINKPGKLLEVHLNRNLYEPYLKKPPGHKDIQGNMLFRVWHDLVIKKKMLELWKDELKQMHVNIIDTGLNINGHLISPRKTSKTNGNPNASLTILMIFKDGKVRANAKKRIKNKILKCKISRLSGNRLGIKIPVEDASVDNDCCLVLIKEITKHLREEKNCNDNITQLKIDWHIDFNSFQLVFEPSITPMRVDRLLDTALQLRFQTHGITAIPWETLATEAGFEHVDEVKLIFHRIALLARIYFHVKAINSGKSLSLMDQLRAIAPETPGTESAIRPRFIELDGEWTIELQNGKGQSKSIISNDEDFKTTVCRFHKWLTVVLTGQEEDIEYKNCDSDNPAERYMIIENKELSYLLNEDNSEEKKSEEQSKQKDNKTGILFPESRSYLNRDHQRNIGMNMVISGPAGVGKSTLSMEILTKGEFSDKSEKSLYAYYSLEQPTESISKTSAKLIIPDKQEIIYSLPETLSEVNKSLLFIPKLVPRTYGDGISEDRLFWFRYNQIVDFLELMRNSEFNPERKYVLTAIVIDSLNAFSRSPLARQQIHQLFKLISWYGILGIHIIENDPSNESGSFQSEVEFLSDIAIRLGWNRDKYQYKVMEVVKSRCQRHVLGRHPFKIRLKPEDGKISRTIFEANTNSYGFEIYPSLHTQISKSAKKGRNDEKNTVNGDGKNINKQNTNNGTEQFNFIFSCNEELRNIVHKSKETTDHEGETGIPNDAFIALQGRSGGHKLAIGMSYIHANKGGESALILNLGQPINYEAVADSHNWWNNQEYTQEKDLAWEGNSKLSVDFYSLGISIIDNKSILPPVGTGVIYVLNFHAGFLLPEEFLQAVKLFIKDVSKPDSNRYPIKRVLFNSTTHLPEQYPLLAANPLFLHALVRILKQERISLLTIGVKGGHHEDRVMDLSTMSDINVNIHDFTDETLHPCCKHELLNKLKTSGLPSSNIRVITSDNITGKDYLKRYALLEVTPKISTNDPKKRKIELLITPIEKPCDNAD